MADLGQLVKMLGCSLGALHRDELYDRRIEGKHGWIYAQPEGFYLYFIHSSPRSWTFTKKVTEFCRVTQDGDGEGFMLLNHLPTKAEARIIMDRMGIRWRRQMTEAGLAALARARDKIPLRAQGRQSLGGEG